MINSKHSKIFRPLFIIFILFIFACLKTYAAAENNFDFAGANKIIKSATQESTAKTNDVTKLQNIIEQLLNLRQDAKKCLEYADNNIIKISSGLQEVQIENKYNKSFSEAQLYLHSKQKTLLKQRSKCHILLLRAEDNIKVLNEKINNLKAKKLFTNNTNFFKNIINLKNSYDKSKIKFDKNIFLKNSGFDTLTEKGNLIIIALLLLISIIYCYKQKYFFERFVNKYAKTVEIKNKFVLTMAKILNRYLIFILPFTVLTLITFFINFPDYKITLTFILMLGLLCLTLVFTLTDILFYPFFDNKALLGISSNISHKLCNRLKIFGVFLLIGFFSCLAICNQPNLTDLALVLRTIFITILTINILSIIWLFIYNPIIFRYNTTRFLFSFIAASFLLLILTADWLGYHRLGDYLLTGIILSTAYTFAAWLSCKIIHEISLAINYPKNNVSNWRYKLFAVNKNQIVPEISWIAFTLYIAIWCTVAVLMLTIWELSPGNFRTTINLLWDGFKIATYTIVPSHILFAALLSGILLLIIKVIRAFITSRNVIQENTGKKDSQHLAIAAIINYVGVALVILITLLIAGVNFAGLAIIAGALSVGIGFGLKDIINNFVCGIILLIERPIKPGDRIVIGNQEGYVKKISIRATRIQTLGISDVIIPNSEIISGQLTNLMFSNFYHGITVDIKIKYGTDVEVVRNILLNAANKHQEIISDDECYNPLILLSKFGDDGLEFKLMCIIKNVNLKLSVLSELHCSLYKAFTENNIPFAYPQRDVHLDSTSATKKAEDV